MERDGDPLFSNGLNLATLAASSDLLQDSWAAISELEKRVSPRVEPTTFRSDGDKPAIVEEFHYPNYTIIAFVTLPVTTGRLQEERDLVSSSEIPNFQFLCSKENPTFGINRAAISLFNSLGDELSQLKERVLTPANFEDDVPNVITGHCLGGSIASLFTLWLLKTFNPTRSRHPLCITFGSPLLGDSAFQQAVLQRSTWNICFLHVVHKDDSFPRLFLRPPTTNQSPYKPFGTFLLCSELGGAYFEAPESVMGLLTSDIVVGNQESESVDYKNVIECLEQRLIYDNWTWLSGQEADSFKAGVTMQVTAVGLEPFQNEGNDAMIEEIVKHEGGVLKQKKEAFDPVEFREMAEHLNLLEVYVKRCRANGQDCGYYDRFKIAPEGPANGVDKYMTILTNYWEGMVKEAKKNPQTSGEPLPPHLLSEATRYRSIVEALVIAKYYKSGQNDYLNGGRSEHYELLEQWQKDYEVRKLFHSSNKNFKDIMLTEDSCLWAHVEEAIRSCRLLASGRSSNSSERKNLLKFEEYVMGLINNNAVSTDIFLEKSSFMQWWREYEEILEKQMMGPSHNSQSQLVAFMRNDPRENYPLKVPIGRMKRVFEM